MHEPCDGVADVEVLHVLAGLDYDAREVAAKGVSRLAVLVDICQLEHGCQFYAHKLEGCLPSGERTPEIRGILGDGDSLDKDVIVSNRRNWTVPDPNAVTLWDG